MIIAIDFDGTCVKNAFPNIGESIGAESVLRELTAKGHKLILYTMRSNRPTAGATGDDNIHDVTGNFLDDAVQWFADNNIPLYAIQTNPTQSRWTTSPKAYAELYIDDSAMGLPLIYDNKSEWFKTRKQIYSPYIDWVKIRIELVKLGLLN